MQRLAKVVIAGAVFVALLAFFIVFFFVPTMLWYNATGDPIATANPNSYPVYRSLGCATIGFGVIYSPGWFGVTFGCNIQSQFPGYSRAPY